MSINKQNMIEKSKVKNRLSSQNYEKVSTRRKEHNISNLTNTKVFNGLVKEEKIFLKI